MRPPLSKKAGFKSSIARNFLGMQTMRCFLFGRYLKPILNIKLVRGFFKDALKIQSPDI